MYGHQILKLHYVLLERPSVDDVFALLLKYCSNGTLIELSLGDISGHESRETIGSLQPVFKHLKSLTLENYDLWLTDLDMILKNFPVLEKLNLDVLKTESSSLRSTYNIDIAKLLRNSKTPLKELSVNRSKRSWDKNIAVINLLKIFEQQQLRVFEMKGFVGEKIDTNIFNQLLPALEVLSLRNIDDHMDFEPLLKLVNLKDLEIHVTEKRLKGFADFMKRLALQNRLEGFSLYYGGVSVPDRVSKTVIDVAMASIFDSLSSLSSLKALKIDKCIDDIFDCAVKIPNLHHFTVSYDILCYTYQLSGLKRDLRLNVLKIVTNASQLKTLHINCNESIWTNTLFDALVKIRRDNKSKTILLIYALLDLEMYCDKKLKQNFELMISNFVNVFPTLSQKYPW